MVAVLKPCTAAVLICVVRLNSRAALSIGLGAWSVSCVGLRSFRLIVGASGVLCSSAVPGVWSFRVKLQTPGTTKEAIHVVAIALAEE